MTLASLVEDLDPKELHRPHRRPGVVPLTIEFLETETTDVTDFGDELDFDEADTLPGIPL